ncbi:MAG: transporter substrate-binding domain-containing protein [Clostridiales Family XIII bacterium]|jgi:polar amino acid transport system substrate-binding protein|nr:transporter substrate-binding domain-containing protein [Clostridiales Family XIII bacterium]
MKKRIGKVLTLLVAGALALSLAACGGSGGGGGGDTVEDLAKVTEAGKMVIGMTVYEPMNYYESDGTMVGFDTEYAQAVCEKLGIEPEFIEIEWDNKEIELDAGNIDAIWNGMTYTEERDENMDFSKPYIANDIVVVVRAEDAGLYTSKEDLVSASIVSEGGSTGEECVVNDDVLSEATFTPVDSLINSLMEVSAGTADAAAVDSVMANYLVGKGSYENLIIIPDLVLSEEVLAIGFRSGSDLPAKVDEITQELVEDGTLTAIAEKYGQPLLVG